MTDTHKDAREALASSLDDEGPDFFVYSRAAMREVAALVEAQDAKIAALQSAVDECRVMINDWVVTYAPELCSEAAVQATSDRISREGGTLAYIAAMNERIGKLDTAATAAAHDARIRAEERERCAAYCETTEMGVVTDTRAAVFAGSYVPGPYSGSGRHAGMAYAAALRAMGGDDD